MKLTYIKTTIHRNRKKISYLHYVVVWHLKQQASNPAWLHVLIKWNTTNSNLQVQSSVTFHLLKIFISNR